MRAPHRGSAGGRQPAGEAAAPTGDKTKIDFWHIQATTPEENQAAVDRFMADNPDVEVEVSVLQNDPFKTKIKVADGRRQPAVRLPVLGRRPAL